MISSGISVITGFVFWVIVARLYSASDVGIAVVLISAVGIISQVSLFGFDASAITILRTSEE